MDLPLVGAAFCERRHRDRAHDPSIPFTSITDMQHGCQHSGFLAEPAIYGL